MVEVLASTMRLSAVTFTVSATTPTGRVKSTVTTAAAETAMLSIAMVLKASRDTVMR